MKIVFSKVNNYRNKTLVAEVSTSDTRKIRGALLIKKTKMLSES